MKASKLDSRVLIEEPVISRTAMGDEVKSWQELGWFWADVRHLNGKEYIKADADTRIAQSSVRIRLNRAINPNMRVKFRGVFYQIIAVLHDEGKRTYTDLVCASLQDDGR